jgi:hypothetical protein
MREFIKKIQRPLMELGGPSNLRALRQALFLDLREPSKMMAKGGKL